MWKLLAVPGFSILAASVAAGTAAAGTTDVISLKNRQFRPADLPPTRSETLGEYQILQLSEPVNFQTTRRLAAAGVTVLGYVPQNAVIAHVPKGNHPDAFTRIAWRGELLPGDKLSAKLGQTGVEGYAMVEAFGNVSPERLDHLITESGGQSVAHPDLSTGTVRLVRLGKHTAQNLAACSEISYVFPASPALVSGKRVHICPGPLTPAGPVARFARNSEGWDGNGLNPVSLNYFFGKGTDDIPGNAEFPEVERALHEWSKHAEISWNKLSQGGQNRSIDVYWERGDHGDGFPFDGLGPVLAHCFTPYPSSSETYAGDLHFDDDHDWSIGTNGSTWDVFTVALHEVGHGLGLDHSDDPEAVMYYSVSQGTVRTSLHQDDIDGIHALYKSKGPRRVYVNKNYSGEEFGSMDRPYNTVNKGYNNATNDDTLVIEKGNYPETLTINKRITITSQNGAAVIGQ